MSQFIKKSIFFTNLQKRKQTFRVAKLYLLLRVYYVFFRHLKLTIFYHSMTTFVVLPQNTVTKKDNLGCHILNSEGKQLKHISSFISGISPGTNVWIGCYREPSSRGFVWIDSQSLSLLSPFWNHLRPDENVGKDCASMALYKEAKNGQHFRLRVDDNSCHDKYFFICENKP